MIWWRTMFNHKIMTMSLHWHESAHGPWPKRKRRDSVILLSKTAIGRKMHFSAIWTIPIKWTNELLRRSTTEKFAESYCEHFYGHLMRLIEFYNDAFGMRCRFSMETSFKLNNCFCWLCVMLEFEASEFSSATVEHTHTHTQFPYFTFRMLRHLYPALLCIFNVLRYLFAIYCSLN